MRLLLAAALVAASASAHAACYQLTFDDGPGPYTGQLLDTLKAEGVHATFFLIGQNARMRPDLVRRELAEGHAVGNHSMTHPEHAIARMGANAVRANFSRAESVLASITGTRILLARVPGCARSRAIHSALGGYDVVPCGIDPRDWEHRDSAYVTRYVLAHATPGEPILLHDIHKTTVAAVPRIIAGLKARGACFESISANRTGVVAAAP